jgi:hypothetical protein
MVAPGLRSLPFAINDDRLASGAARPAQSVGWKIHSSHARRQSYELARRRCHTLDRRLSDGVFVRDDPPWRNTVAVNAG